ncbi:nitrogen permease regulator of amino acid transport activity 3-domain-containing protein [Lipomyces arxii]|uniref:nitrogen permease regulator of amino acid transport activity 3-domain-containing protein n=1 Tax=Lipomyces arxii TaxID=56418 RepID=UPI0034CD0C6F
MSNSDGRAPFSAGHTPHLLSIIFTITTPNGPQFVFNYPQTTQPLSSHTRKTSVSPSRRGRRSRQRNQDGSIPFSAPSSPPVNAMQGPTFSSAFSRLSRFDSPNSSSTNSSHDSSDSDSGSGSSGSDVSASKAGSDQDDADSELSNDDLNLDFDDAGLSESRRSKSKNQPLLSLSQTLARHGERDTASEAEHRHAHRRSRRRRKHAVGSGFLSRQRSHTPNRRTNLSHSMTLNDDEDEGSKQPVSALSAEIAKASGANTASAQKAGISQISAQRRGISPSSAVIASPHMTPRLSALSSIDTSMITSTLNLDDIADSLRQVNTGYASRSTSQTRGLSRRGSADNGHHQHHHSTHRSHLRKTSSGKIDRDSDEDNDRNRSNEYGNDGGHLSHSMSLTQQPWEQVFGYDADFLAALLCPRRSMCDTKFEFTVGDLAFLGLPMHIRQDGKWKRAARERTRRWRRRPAGSTSASGTMKSMTSESDRFDGVFGYDEATAEGDDYEDDEYYDDDGEAESSTNALDRSLISLNLESSQASSQQGSTFFGNTEEISGNDFGQSTAELGTSLSNNINNMFHAFQDRRNMSVASAGDAYSDNIADRSATEATDDQSDGPSAGPSSHSASQFNSAVPSPLLDGLPSSRKQSESRDQENAMNLFNVVFVMSPPELEYNVRIEEMYDYVVAPLAECLRYEQHKSGYVWKQAQTMLRLRERAAVTGMSQDELWSQTLTSSSLALALAQIYLAISTSSIANVVINSSTRSFQIPIRMYSAALPSMLEPVKVPNFYLTTEDYAIPGSGQAGQNENAGLPFLEHALLLLDEPENIITEIQIDPRSPLAKFIHAVSPADTLVKVATMTEMSVRDCENFARHLMYWRRARIIIPIHRRGIYIVAPTAPLSSLRSHSKVFARAFPKMPSLPRLLQEISSHEPRPYGTVIPTHALRERYLEALAWMLRLGYLAQLRTFIWLRVSGAVKLSVAQDELLGQVLEHPTAGTEDDDDDDGYDIVFNGTSRSSRQRLYSMGAILETPHEHEDSILLEPGRANVLERKWMDKIVAGKGERAVELFWKMAKYMNGMVAFEDVPAKEGIERRDVRNLLAVIKESIIISRHW